MRTTELDSLIGPRNLDGVILLDGAGKSAAPQATSLYFSLVSETSHTPEQGAFIIAVLQNAHDLVVEAEILLRAEKWARAYALATFAIEEAGKAWRAQEQFYLDPKKTIARLHHTRKLAAATEMASLFYQVNERGQVDLEELYSEENEVHGQDQSQPCQS